MVEGNWAFLWLGPGHGRREEKRICPLVSRFSPAYGGLALESDGVDSLSFRAGGSSLPDGRGDYVLPIDCFFLESPFGGGFRVMAGVFSTWKKP